jgi:hypothetical protein
MTSPIQRTTLPSVVRSSRSSIGDERRKPNIRGHQVYVGTFVADGSPSNDPAEATSESPVWENDFTYLTGYPVWFAHGLDGETDMGGMYDLVTGSPVSNTIAFHMPREYAQGCPPVHAFPVKVADGEYTLAVQEITIPVSGPAEVRIIWPIVADIIVGGT